MEIQEKQRKNKNKKKQSSKLSNKNNKITSNYESEKPEINSSEKLVKVDFASQASVDVCFPKTSATNCSKEQKILGKKSKKRKLLAKKHETSAAQNVLAEKSHGKNKNKKKKHLEVQENAVACQNQIDNSQTKSNKNIREKKDKTEKIDKGKSRNTSTVEVHTPKVQRASPNATKFMFMNLIKQVLQRQKDLSKNKLQKKVLRKYCKVMGVNEKPELVKNYEKSLLLTYGIDILNDTVRLKQSAIISKRSSIASMSNQNRL